MSVRRGMSVRGRHQAVVEQAPHSLLKPEVDQFDRLG